jgi:hypothetical protein
MRCCPLSIMRLGTLLSEDYTTVELSGAVGMTIRLDRDEYSRVAKFVKQKAIASDKSRQPERARFFSRLSEVISK